MIQLHDVAAVVVVCAAVAALTSRDARGMATGLLVAMAVSPVASSPAPSALAISLRVIGADGKVRWSRRIEDVGTRLDDAARLLKAPPTGATNAAKGEYVPLKAVGATRRMCARLARLNCTVSPCRARACLAKAAFLLASFTARKDLAQV